MQVRADERGLLKLLRGRRHALGHEGETLQQLAVDLIFRQWSCARRLCFLFSSHVDFQQLNNLELSFKHYRQLTTEAQRARRKHGGLNGIRFSVLPLCSLSLCGEPPRSI